eukprot:352609-Chlamydomonas_euryale.AAC.1
MASSVQGVWFPADNATVHPEDAHGTTACTCVRQRIMHVHATAQCISIARCSVHSNSTFCGGPNDNALLCSDSTDGKRLQRRCMACMATAPHGVHGNSAAWRA